MSDYTYQLVVQTGPQTGEVYNLTQDLVIVGRDPVSDIAVNDPEVSRQHARLTRSGSGYMIQDMGSTNGTFLDGKRLSGEQVPVAAGQMIAVGSNITLLFMAVPANAAMPAAVAAPESGTVLALPDTDMVPDLPPSLPEEEPIPDPLGMDVLVEPAEEEPESLPEPVEDAGIQDILESRPLPVFRFDEEKAEVEPARPATPAALSLPDLNQQPGAAAAKAASDYDSYRPTPPPARKQPDLPPQNDKSRRRLTIVLVVLAVILCCCCGFFLIMYYWLGDILLEWMGYTAALLPGLMLIGR